MSAFQVTDKHIAYLAHAIRRYIDKPGGEWHSIDDVEAIAREFLYENRRSVATRYEGRHGTECAGEVCPSCGEIVCLPRGEWRPRGSAVNYDGRMVEPCAFARVQVADYPSDQLGITPVGTLKAIQCFEYQACEHDGWEKSKAKAWIDRLLGETIAALPGYEGEPWGIT